MTNLSIQNSIEYTVCSLPKDVIYTKQNQLQLSPSFLFQMEWDLKSAQLWVSLRERERAGLLKPTFPYQEAQIIAFLSTVKERKDNRSMLEKMSALFSNDSCHQYLHFQRERLLIERLKQNKHPLFLMKEIPAGTFMTSVTTEDNADAKHGCNSLLNHSFSIGQHPVTQQLWQDISGENPSHFKGGSLPVEQVSWIDCIRFCNRLSQLEGLQPAYDIQDEEVTCNFSSEGYRLPTEAEWECAASTKLLPDGTLGYPANPKEKYLFSGSDSIDDVAWYSENSNAQSHPVGQKQGNAIGLFDMSGNVSEWCWDTHQPDEHQSTPQFNSTTITTSAQKIYKGGCWRGDAIYNLLSNRDWSSPKHRHFYIGFRLCRTLNTNSS